MTISTPLIARTKYTTMIEELLKAHEIDRKAVQEYSKDKYDIEFEAFKKLLTTSGFTFNSVIEDSKDCYIEDWKKPEPENEQTVGVRIVRYYQIRREYVIISWEYSNPKMWRHHEMESGVKYTSKSVSTNGETYRVATKKIKEIYRACFLKQI